MVSNCILSFVENNDAESLLLLGPFGLDLLLLKLKIKNWKYYSKIIFKYVNSIMRPIFNFFFLNKMVVGSINRT